MKRRVVVYTLLPIILIATAAVIGVAAWQRSQSIGRLADKLAHSEQDEAAAAARQLAVISNPPLELLVDVASSDDRSRAGAAQVALSRVLDQFERDVAAGQRMRQISNQVTEFAAALAGHRRAFSRLSYPWLLDTTGRILRIASRCPTKSPLLAMHCDDVMAVVKLSRPVAPAVAEPAVTPASTASLPERELQRTKLEREFAEYSAEPITPPVAASAPVPPPIEPIVEPGNVRLTQVPPAPVAAEVRPTWAEPMLRIQPASPGQSDMPDGFKPHDEDQVASTPATTDEQSPDGTRELLDRWRTSRADRLEIEEQLATRGFHPIPKRLVEQYFSDDLADRLRLVDNVLTGPRIDPRPWLMLLAEDENAEVRLMAVTVMATSDDKTLVEKAWQTALRDRDSRIADLAARLRTRREGTTRR
jgi:hypothetical protein